jgi:hypothetical protein
MTVTVSVQTSEMLNLNTHCDSLPVEDTFFIFKVKETERKQEG